MIVLSRARGLYRAKFIGIGKRIAGPPPPSSPLPSTLKH